MSVLYISSFAKDHLNLYGNRFIDSFATYCTDPMTIYAEGFDKKNCIDFYETIPIHKQYKNNIQSLIAAEVNNKKISRLKKALRWSYKVYSIIHALETFDYDYIIWIDGDVEAVYNIPNNLASQLCNNQLLYCYKENLKVQNKIETHIESGFLIFNKNHKNLNKVVDGYKQGYYHNKVLDIAKPWDGFWLYKIIIDNNLSNDCKLISNPFSTVKKYFKHHVGKSKFQNQSVDKHLGR